MSDNPQKTVRALAATVPVSEVMVRDVIAVTPDMSVESFATLVLEKGISGAPVVDAAGRVIGVISKTDLVREQQALIDTEEHALTDGREETQLDAELGPGFHLERRLGATVGEIMFPVAFTISPEDSLARAASLMGWEGIHRLPVVAADGTVLGIVTSLDVMRWMAPREPDA